MVLHPSQENAMFKARATALSSVSIWVIAAVSSLMLGPVFAAQGPAAVLEHKVLATNRTSTMERELNSAAEQGCRFRAVMGGETAVGGNEVVAVMTRRQGESSRYLYKLLATSKTSTMQRELQAAADQGFEYVGQSVFKTMFGGNEVVAILERDKDAIGPGSEYHLFATVRTSTMEKELTQAAAGGYDVLGVTVGQTAIGGKELIVIARRPKTP
jgi:hypothetical protein